MTEGFFVTIEGIDGSGKTSLVRSLPGEIAEKDVWTTREPAVRSITKKMDKAGKDSKLFGHLMDRSIHASEDIVPALENDQLVISDRYADSTVAYQTVDFEKRFGSRRASRVLMQELAWWNFPVPDLTIYIDVPPDVSFQRSTDKHSYESLEYLQSVKTEYDMIAENNPRRVKVIDGTMSEDKIRRKAIDLINYLR